MLNNIMNNALTGVNAAQGAMGVIANNMSNATVGYYHRQTAVFGENPGTMTANGYFGNGVHFSHIRREFDEFVNMQYNNARARSGDYETYMKNTSGVDDLLSGSTDDIAGMLGSFFTALDEAASDASDKTLVDVFLGRAKTMVSQLKEADRRLREMDSDINHQLDNKVKDINTYAEKIATLNEQISSARSANGAEPNDLLDVRDRLVNELNSVIGVKVIEQNGNFNVSFANGLPLVTGGRANRLEAMASGSDDSRLSVGFVDSAGNIREIKDEQIRGGELSGILRSRREVIDPARQKLNQMALVLAEKFNEIHRKGYDSNGQTGKDFFAVGGGSVVSNTHNTGKADFDIKYTNVSDVTGSNYDVSFDGTNWNVTRLPEGTAVNATFDPATNTLSFDGMDVSISNSSAQAGDSFLLKPVDNVIGGMDTLINNAADFAAADSTGGASNNENIKELVKLQDHKLVGGTSTLSDYYASLVNEVGSKASQAQIDSEVQNKLTVNFYEQQQMVSGVDPNEEGIQLEKMKVLFNGNAKVLATVEELFDVLMRVL